MWVATYGKVGGLDGSLFPRKQILVYVHLFDSSYECLYHLIFTMSRMDSSHTAKERLLFWQFQLLPEVSAVHGGKIKLLLNLLGKKTTHYESDLYKGWPDSEQFTYLIQVRLRLESEACLHFESGHCRNVLLHNVSARVCVNGSVSEPVS